MKTRVITIDTQSAGPETISEIVQVLRRDGVIVYPTDTFYGLGGNCLSQKALQKIFDVKRKSPSKGLPVLVSGLRMAEALVSECPPVFQALADRFWPGPLTLVLKAASHLPQELIGPKKTIGIRLPDIPWLQALIRETGVALVATSANISGEKEIDSAEEAIRMFKGKVECIVDGGRTPGGKPSTVMDLTEERPVLIREGVIDNKELGKFL